MTRADLRARRRQRAKPADEPTPVDICDNLEPYRITQARGLKGWSRADLADTLGVTAERVGNWEFGARKVRPHELLRLADVLGYPPAFFRNGRPMARLDSSEVWICPVRLPDHLEARDAR